MADRRLKLIARRDDGALLLAVDGSACALTVLEGPDGGVWANDVDAIAARPGWSDAVGTVPPWAEKLAVDKIVQPGWCDAETA